MKDQVRYQRLKEIYCSSKQGEASSGYQSYQQLAPSSRLPHLSSCIEEVSRDEEEASEYYMRQKDASRIVNETDDDMRQMNVGDLRQQEEPLETEENNQMGFHILQESSISKNNFQRKKGKEEKENVNLDFKQWNQDSSTASKGQNDMNLQNQELYLEVDKWKKFGYLVAESYDELKGEHERVKADSAKDKKIISALKEQITTLKQILQTKHLDQSLQEMDQQSLIENLTEENERLKGVDAVKLELETEVKRQVAVIEELTKSLIEAKEELKQMKEGIIRMNEGNQSRNTTQISANSKEHMLLLKKMSQQHLVECSQLAEELICLRSDMDELQHTGRASSQSASKKQSFEQSALKSQFQSNLMSTSKQRAFSLNRSETRGQSYDATPQQTTMRRNGAVSSDVIGSPMPVVSAGQYLGKEPIIGKNHVFSDSKCSYQDYEQNSWKREDSKQQSSRNTKPPLIFSPLPHPNKQQESLNMSTRQQRHLPTQRYFNQREEYLRNSQIAKDDKGSSIYDQRSHRISDESKIQLSRIPKPTQKNSNETGIDSQSSILAEMMNYQKQEEQKGQKLKSSGNEVKKNGSKAQNQSKAGTIQTRRAAELKEMYLRNLQK